MELKRPWNRLHGNNMLATVDRFESQTESVFSAGALPLNGVGMLRVGLRDLASAQRMERLGRMAILDCQEHRRAENPVGLV